MDKQSSIEWLIQILQKNDYLKKEIPKYIIECAIQVHESEIKRAYLADDVNRFQFKEGRCVERLDRDKYYQQEYGKEVTSE